MPSQLLADVVLLAGISSCLAPPCPALCPLQTTAYQLHRISSVCCSACRPLCNLSGYVMQVLLHWACAKVSASADTADEALLSALDSRLKGQPAIRFCPGPAGHGSVPAYAC